MISLDTRKGIKKRSAEPATRQAADKKRHDLLITTDGELEMQASPKNSNENNTDKNTAKRVAIEVDIKRRLNHAVIVIRGEWLGNKKHRAPRSCKNRGAGFFNVSDYL